MDDKKSKGEGGVGHGGAVKKAIRQLREDEISSLLARSLTAAAAEGESECRDIARGSREVYGREEGDDNQYMYGMDRKRRGRGWCSSSSCCSV